MASFNKYDEAKRNAQSNANASGKDWCVFATLSGRWYTEEWHGEAEDMTWAGIKPEVVHPA
jgi:hypothetical protein